MSKHNKFIKLICEKHGAETRLWLHSLAEVLFEGGSPEWQENFPFREIKEDLKQESGNMTPDAFKIVSSDKKFIWWEVEISNPMPEWKICRLASLELELCEWDWSLEIRVVDRYGNDRQVHPAKDEKHNWDMLSSELYREYLEQLKNK